MRDEQYGREDNVEREEKEELSSQIKNKMRGETGQDVEEENSEEVRSCIMKEMRRKR